MGPDPNRGFLWAAGWGVLESPSGSLLGMRFIDSLERSSFKPWEVGMACLGFKSGARFSSRGLRGILSDHSSHAHGPLGCGPRYPISTQIPGSPLETPCINPFINLFLF